VLTREEVQARGQSLQTEVDLSQTEGKSYKKISSGSTGRPIQVLITERTDAYWRALTLRDHLWHRRDFSQSLAVIKKLRKEQIGPPGVESSSWGPSSALLYKTGPSFMISSATDVRDQYAWLREKQPGYLLTYPSLLRELAYLNLAADQPLRFRDVATMGETLSPDTRELVRHSFGAKVCDIYSWQEMGYLALQCPESDRYHVQSEACLLEVLDENNQPCQPGVMGRVVVTHLHNRVMPLIRYDIGDYAIVGESCDCGINFPVLERVIGRTRSLVTYPDGRRSWPAFSMTKLAAILPNVQLQVVQTTVDTLLVRIGTGNPVAEATLSQMKSIINDAMGYPFQVQFEQLGSLSRSKSGKFEDFYSRVGQAEPDE